MLAFLVRRLIGAIIVLASVGLLAFIMFTFVGDPVDSVLGQDATPEQRAMVRTQLGLDDPAPVQFFRFVGKALQGDFGMSYRLGLPVSTLLLERLPATLELVFAAALIAFVLAIPLGVYTGLNRNGPVARVVLAVSLVGVSLPTFLIGILLIYVFSVTLGWFPAFGRGEVVQIGWWSTGLLTPEGRAALVLPALTLSLFQTTLILRLVRASMLEVLRSDFIKFARARGLRDRTVHFGHALKNTLVPVITVAGLQIGALIGFSIVTETVFQWPGMGYLFLQAIQYIDIPVMSAYLVFIAFTFVSINLVVDLLYFVVDPRLRVDGTGAG